MRIVRHGLHIGIDQRDYILVLVYFIVTPHRPLPIAASAVANHIRTRVRRKSGLLECWRQGVVPFDTEQHDTYMYSSTCDSSFVQHLLCADMLLLRVKIPSRGHTLLSYVQVRMTMHSDSHWFAAWRETTAVRVQQQRRFAVRVCVQHSSSRQQ